MPTFLSEEIFCQKKVLQQTYDTNRETIISLAKLIKDYKPKGYTVVVCGSANNAGLYFQSLSAKYLGSPVAVIDTCLIDSGDEIYLKDYVVFAFSESGECQDVLQIAQKAYKQGAIVVSVTNNENSSLAKIGQHLFFNVGEIVTQSGIKTFLAQMLLFYMLTEALTDKYTLLAADTQLPALIDATLRQRQSINKIAEEYVSVSTNLFVLSGQTTVSEKIAYILRQNCLINANALDICQFLDAAVLLDKTYTVVMFASDDDNKPFYLDICAKTKASKGKLIVFTECPLLAEPAHDFVLLPEADKCFLPYVQTIAGMLFAWSLSVKKGINTDSTKINNAKQTY